MRPTSATLPAPPRGTRRFWLVLLVAPPRSLDRMLRDALRAIKQSGARRISRGTYLVPDAHGMSEDLAALANLIRSNGGEVLVADSRMIEGEGTPPGEAPGEKADV